MSASQPEGRRTSCGVLIAGGGAVGMMTALALSERAVPVTVLEEGQGLTEQYRASTFHPPTLDLLDRYGLAVPLIAAGNVARTVQYRDWEEGLIAEFDLSVLAGSTDHPFRVQKDQHTLSEMLLERLSHRPDVEILFGHRVLSAGDEGGEATAVVDTLDGRVHISAPYLVGADGANSAVRRSAGIGFEGKTYPDRYVTVFTPFAFERRLRGFGPVNYVSDPVDWTVLLRAPEHWRVLYPARPGETDEQALSPQAVSRRLSSVAGCRADFEVEHARIYRVHQRVASTLRSGRILLAGDAAHVNNPLGGMGLNGGLADAEALAVALSDVWHGRSGESALDGYSARRRRFALEHVGGRTDENAREISLSDPAARSAWRGRMRAIARDPERARRFLLEASLLS